MRVAALYDIHGNLPALEAVLADPRVATADVIVADGDILGGPQTVEVIDRLDGLGGRVRYVRGNADREVIEGSDAHGLDWCTERLGHERLELELNCTEYDVERTAAAFRRLDFVNAEQHAGWLLEPPDPDETTKFFEGSRKPSSAS